MSTVAFARIAREEIMEEVKSVESGILNGTKSWDEYLSLVGKRRGLIQALASIDETTSRFDDQD